MKYKGLHVGDVQIDRLRNGYPNELLVVFQDSMRRTLEVSIAEYDEVADADDYEMITVAQYVGPGASIADRLDALGFTAATTHELLTGFLAETRQQKERVFRQMSADNVLDDELTALHDREIAYLDGYTSERWIEEIREAAEHEERGHIYTAGTLAWLLDVAGPDPRVVLRAAVLAWPDAEVRLDATEDEESGHESPETACSEALNLLRAVGAEHAPLVVLTEGKTDVKVLQPALGLLYPHLTDLVRFMDYDQRPMGGAGALASMVRAFAAAGIANKIVALFDNDTAASDALRNLNLRSLPANIRVHQYPRLILAEKYPTLGPPSEQFPGGRIDVADVNGLACSIELYLGRDVLVPPGSEELRPVQWHSYIAGMRRYQGEVVDKGSLMDVYEAKLRAATADPAVIDTQDWSGIHAIIKLLIGSVNDQSTE